MLANFKGKWLPFVLRNWPIFALLIISFVLCFRNYVPGTFLSGWDTLHPEFNFGLAFQRMFFGVFRTEQGLGAVAGHSHMADLPRVIFLYISHFVLPLNFLRYFYIFTCIVIGPLGMYFFLQKHIVKQKTASFLGALFYLLNLGTMQTFNVPFEMFTTLFATLPFLFYFSSSFITQKEHRVRNLFLFAVLSLLSSPMAYAATLWYVFFACFLIYLFLLSIVHFKENRNSFKSFAILIIVFVTINLFWLVPNIYFVLNHGNEVAHANINRLFSDQAFLRNKEFGNISDILLLKSFYFDWNIYAGNNAFTDLLSPFINYLKNPLVLLVSYVFGISFIAGAVFFAKKEKLKSLPFFGVLLFALLFLVNDNFPFAPVFNFFQAHIPFFKEALRFPDDKILNVYVFLVSIFFAYCSYFIIEKIKKINIKLETLFGIIVTILIIFYALPSFNGNFINSYMKVQIPNQYFQLFSYLNTQNENLRIANLPIHSPWGWVYYNWYGNNKSSYQGAGFLYFGIKQPLLDRDFDRWSPYNESYYREMSYAIYKQDANLLSNVVKKYKIGFVFIDKSVIDPPNPNSTLYFNESKSLLEKTGLIEYEKDFGNIELFKIKGSFSSVSSVNSNINVNPTTTTTYEDFAYDTYKNYITADPTSNFSNSLYPFRNLIDNQSKLHSYIFSIDNEKITLNPSNKITNFQTGILSQNLNLIPSDLLVQRQASNLTLSFYLNTPVFDQTPSSQPIKGTVNIGNPNRNLSLSINQNELFNLGVLPENTPLALGKVLLKNDLNTISAFDTTQTTPIPNVSKAIVPFFTPCANGGITEKGQVSDNKMEISGKGDLCLLIPYGFFPTSLSGQNANILTDFQFRFGGNANITSCLFSQDTSQCLYYENPVRNGNIASFPYVLSTDKTGKRAIKIFFKSQNSTENNYLLTDFTSWYSKSIIDLNLSKDFIAKTFLDKQNVSFNKIYLPRNIVYDPGFTVTNVNKLSNDCQSLLFNSKKEIVKTNGIEAVKYTSNLGSFCDHFSYQNLPHNQGYLIVVNSKNQSGLPLTMCITDYTSRKCDIYSDLTVFKSFDKDVFLLPPMDKTGLGYDINLENLGVKGSPSINYLSDIQIIPIPYEFLDNIQNFKANTNIFNGNVESVTKYNPSLYVVKTDGKMQVLDLNLSFEKGFKAYEINCSGYLSCLIISSLSPVFGKEIKEQVLVNNWSNGFITNAKTVAIVFLPQYFEYLGLILIIASFILLLYRLKQRK